ncbi:MAG TPA: acetate/propionate family kinase [Bradyrhizobium sp.]
MPQAILALNTGSSSIKFAVYAVNGSELVLLCRGLLDHHAGDTHFVIRNPAGEVLQDAKSGGAGSGADLATTLIDRIEPLLDGHKLTAVGHRIVHGGPDFCRPVQVDSDVLLALDALTPLAPLHQPGCLAPVRSLLSARPTLPQVACFDTAFHRDLAPVYRRFPLPLEFETKGLRRYGFHGLSFEYIVQRLNRPAIRLVVAHLGSGSSLCAIRDGKSVNTTMSLTPLDGLMMATRSGAIDPGLVLHLWRSEQMSASEIEDLLYHKSGLAGVSGISADMRTLIGSSNPRASDAIDQFCARAAEQAAVMAAGIDGIELLVFTGGIGENSPEVRKNICMRLGWMGLELDEQANMAGRDVVSAPAGRIEVRVIATDEEFVIARHTLEATSEV